MPNTSYQRHSADFWRKTVAEFQQSTLSGSAFCKQKEIAYASFCKWRKKLQPVTAARDPVAVPTFIDLQTVGESTKLPWRIVLKLDSGIELLLSQG